MRDMKIKIGKKRGKRLVLETFPALKDQKRVERDPRRKWTSNDQKYERN